MTTGTPGDTFLGRRTVLRTLGGGLALPLLSGCGLGRDPLPDPSRPGSRLDSVMRSADSYLDVTNQNTGEHLALRFLDDGNYDRRAIRRLDWLFRDWREDKHPEIDPRIYWGLAALSDAARRDGQSGRITLLSGYRTKRTNNMLRQQGKGAASNSFHTHRRAADIRLDGVPMEQVADYAEWLQIGGVGRYHGSDFTHIDSGPTRTWSA
ncbi:hypothetical protein Rumeso_00318 [Rubellimicrobium mesophilum DSM 19309]|uniref:Murein endopeptidase K n=1 Tax=Rubellimicrobium mesophilum DSM 19309 TaxID=442562 RepID=A0A017HUE0_9RHOB|nr:DUF882 domain-containing protein [Rubellimicrobium mesophilum]EYD78082.1 hypothetical protein Rumeso_00318 [Rubellimicrobium mesophilum DSM 19309]